MPDPGDSAQQADKEPIDVEPSRGESITHDLRPPMPEPPPVRLISVADVHLPAAIGREPELDALYVGLLGFERRPYEGQTIAYASETFWLVFDLVQPPVERESLNPTMIEVASLADLRETLGKREIPFDWIKSILPASYAISLQDPAGNWLSITERRILS